MKAEAWGQRGPSWGEWLAWTGGYFSKLVGAGAGVLASAARWTRSLAANVPAAPSASGPAELAMANFIANPPFSFSYAGTSSQSLLPTWKSTRRTITNSPGRHEELVTWRAPTGELEVRASVVSYETFSAFEWTVTFVNPSAKPSKRLSDVLAADTIINASANAPYVLHYFNGSSAQANDYAPQTSTLTPGTSQLLYPLGGRPSNGTWPYFNIDWQGHGTMVAVGWPGQWTAELGVEQEGLRLRAAMTSADPLEHNFSDINGAMPLDSYLEAGEEVRTPLIVLMRVECRELVACTECLAQMDGRLQPASIWWKVADPDYSNDRESRPPAGSSKGTCRNRYLCAPGDHEGSGRLLHALVGRRRLVRDSTFGAPAVGQWGRELVPGPQTFSLRDAPDVSRGPKTTR